MELGKILCALLPQTNTFANNVSIKEKNILYKNGKSYVELIVNNDSISEIEIQTGISDGIYTEVISDLDKLDRVKIQ